MSQHVACDWLSDSATLAAHPFYEALINYVQEGGFYKSAFEI